MKYDSIFKNWLEYYRGRLLLRTPAPFPYETCICCNNEAIFSWTCHVYGPFGFWASVGTSILLLKANIKRNYLFVCNILISDWMFIIKGIVVVFYNYVIIHYVHFSLHLFRCCGINYWLITYQMDYHTFSQHVYDQLNHYKRMCLKYCSQIF